MSMYKFKEQYVKGNGTVETAEHDKLSMSSWGRGMWTIIRFRDENYPILIMVIYFFNSLSIWFRL